MEFDPTFTWSNLLAMITLFVSVATAFYAWFSSRRANVDDRFKAGSDRMDRHENRLVRVEQSLEVTPSREDIHKLELSMAQMNGTMTRIEAVMEGNQNIMTRLENIVSRHEVHLLEQGKDK